MLFGDSEILRMSMIQWCRITSVVQQGRCAFSRSGSFQVKREVVRNGIWANYKPRARAYHFLILVNRTLRGSNEWHRITKHTLHVIHYKIFSEDGWLLHFVGDGKCPLPGHWPNSILPRIFRSNETQILPLSPGPIASVRAFLSVCMRILTLPVTILVQPLSLSLGYCFAKTCFLISVWAIISQECVFSRNW
jgi:hypothetical protein